MSLPCRSLSTRWNTVLRKSRSRHAGDSDARFSDSTTCVTEARIRLSILDVNLRMHFSGSMSQASLESPVHGGVRCGSRSSPRTSEMMCSCGGSCAMARTRSVSFSAEPPSRDWRMEASFSCAGPICGRRVREVAPPEAYMEGMDPAPPLPVFLPVMDLLIVDLVAEAGDGTWGRWRGGQRDVGPDWGRFWLDSFRGVTRVNAHLGRWRSSVWRCPAGPPR